MPHENNKNKLPSKTPEGVLPWLTPDAQTVTEVVGWADVDPALMGRSVQVSEFYGVATMYTRSKDGGALVLRLYKGGAATPFYFRTSEEAEDFLRDHIKHHEDRQEKTTKP